MIKALACAIQTYTIACFKFPKRLCESMNGSLARFWWGQKFEERKIHWRSWILMTMAKSLGGIGFKDLEVFNNALLVKQCWRMMVEPFSFWAKVLKGVYFHDRDLLQ